MMTSVSKQPAKSPKQAARRKAPVDRLLDHELFKALSDPTRARLLACLVKCGRACSVTEVAECCDVDFSVVARHLSLLARAGVLESNKEGRTVWYSVRTREVCEHLRALADAFEQWQPADCCGGDCCTEKGGGR